MGNLKFEAYDTSTLPADRLEEVINAYTSLYRELDDPFRSGERFRRQITGHMQAPAWQLVLALDPSEVAGFAYGFGLAADTRWWEGLLFEVDPGFTREDGTRTFAISEINVLPPWRGQGLAGSLYRRLLADRNEQRATLLTRPDNDVAHAIYEHWGWKTIGQTRPSWEHAPVFDVMMKALDKDVRADRAE